MFNFYNLSTASDKTFFLKKIPTEQSFKKTVFNHQHKVVFKTKVLFKKKLSLLFVNPANPTIKFYSKLKVGFFTDKVLWFCARSWKFCKKETFFIKLIKSAISLFIFNSTIEFKEFLNYTFPRVSWFYHKKFTKSIIYLFKILVSVLKFCGFSINFRIFVKGKLGLVGGAKKKKIMHRLFSNYNNKFYKSLSVDHVPIISRAGVATFKLFYLQTTQLTSNAKKFTKVQ